MQSLNRSALFYCLANLACCVTLGEIFLMGIYVHMCAFWHLKGCGPCVVSLMLHDCM